MEQAINIARPYVSPAVSENQEKLAARYGEKFEVQRSEIRKDGDL